MENKSSGSALKTILGVILGIALSFVYLKYGWTPPAFLQIMGMMKSIPETTMADSILSDPDSSYEQRQRAVIALIKNDDEFYKEIDEEIGFTKRVIDKRIKRKLLILKELVLTLESAKKRGIARGLDIYYSNHTRNTVAKEIKKDKLLFHYFRERFPKSSAEEMAEAFLSTISKPVPQD